MDSIKFFSELPFIVALKSFFNDLKVPMNYVADEPTTAKDILKDTYKDNDTFQLINDVYFVGMVDDAAFDGNQSLDVEKIKSDYDGILIFGITLKERPNGLFPTRSQLAEISRAFNREFYYTPVVVVFKYNDHLAFANTERLKYKQEWREGEKAGKVSLLRDVSINQPHSGHLRILRELKVPTTGTKRIDSFAALYLHWQEVFSVNVLNKKFYLELSNWYFWAIKHVIFPGKPTMEEAIKKNANIDDLILEHKAINVIRMLTRLLFVWFIKEKKLIPEELFELEVLQKKILKDISPYHEYGLFTERSVEGIYYKAILQNLFFATLNCPIKADNIDKRSRGFRNQDQNYGVTFLMRHEQYFKDKDAFLELVNSKVPFLNGGLFECLDERGVGEKKDERTWIDGFSDNLPKDQKLVVPDYLFFGLEEETDLSDVIGINDKKYKRAAVKGLINILKSYKFTITENTPIEEDVALDPELLGKVFENLLASYNPETKTTARKQTGSFYTPREIVSYMVDESLIAYLKNAIKEWNGLDDNSLDKALRSLISFDSKDYLLNNPDLKKEIISKLNTCTILDPACGSGAFPMGILQKMVHILQKLDPDNDTWKEVQLERAYEESKAAFEIEDKHTREERLLEINEVFDQNVNDPDYARKLYLIENCIYGVDIQPIAIQIAKLRFFISLVVEQRVNPNKVNFGIRPLPNLETKFVSANTLIGIEKPSAQLSLYDTKEVRILESELKKVRSKLFGAKSKETKLKHRKRDEELRNAIANELEKSGWKSDTAKKLASWDPYNQNASSNFFDPEWMFDIKDGFDVIIGNPPYINANELKKRLGEYDYEFLKSGFVSAKGTIDIYILFFEFGLRNLSEIGHLIYITPNRYLSASYGEALRGLIHDQYSIISISDFSSVKVFEAASTYPIVSLIGNSKQRRPISIKEFNDKFEINKEWENQFSDLNLLPGKIWGFLLNSKIDIVKIMISKDQSLSSCGIINATSTAKEADEYHDLINEKKGLKLINTGTIDRFLPLWGKSTLTDKGSTFLKPYLDIDSRKISMARKKLYQSPKIIFAKIGLRTEAFFDQNGEFASINTNCIHSFKTEYHPKYITLWVNSLLYQFLFSCFFEGLKMAGGYLLYSAPNLKSTYIKKPSHAETNVAINLYDFQIWCLQNNNSINIDTIIDGYFFNLYFPDHMNEREINIIEFVEQDIVEVMQGREFDKMNNEEKEKVIEQLSGKWNHPDNGINNRIKLFAVRSPEILRPILEG